MEISDKFADELEAKFDSLEHYEQLALVAHLLLIIAKDSETDAMDGLDLLIRKLREAQLE